MFRNNLISWLTVFVSIMKPWLLWVLFSTVVYAIYLVLLGGSLPFTILNINSASKQLIGFSWVTFAKHLAGFWIPVSSTPLLSQSVPYGLLVSSLYKSAMVVSGPLIASSYLVKKDKYRVWGVRAKAIQIRKTEGETRGGENKWLALEEACRRSDYARAFGCSAREVPKSALDDSDIECDYWLVVLYANRFVFFGEKRVFASCRLYSCNEAIKNEIGEKHWSKVNSTRTYWIVDRLSVPRFGPAKIYCKSLKFTPRDYRALVLGSLYGEIFAQFPGDGYLALARQERNESLLLRYALLSPQILGKRKYAIGTGNPTKEFWVIRIERENIEHAIRGLQILGAEIARKAGITI